MNCRIYTYIMFTHLLFILITVELFGCKSSNLSSLQPEKWYLNSWDAESAEAAHSRTWVSDPVDHDKATLRFEVRHLDTWENHNKKTYRSEVSTSYYPEMRAACSYSFDIYLPQDFPQEDNRLVLAQWWGKTKKYLGESPRSPAVALRFRNGKLYVTVRHSSNRVITDPDSVPEEQIYKNYAFQLGKWNHFDFKMVWDFKDSGRVLVKLNELTVADYKGPVGYNDDVAPEFQFGIYRDDSPNTYVVYFKNVKLNCGK